MGVKDSIQDYLRETSIHGLRYLVEARGVVTKLIWLLTILASVTSAVVLSYLNIKNWLSLPTMVTLVKPDLAVGSNYMPMVTVCPRYGNVNNLLFNLIEKYKDEIDTEKYYQDINTTVTIPLDQLTKDDFASVLLNLVDIEHELEDLYTEILMDLLAKHLERDDKSYVYFLVASFAQDPTTRSFFGCKELKEKSSDVVLGVDELTDPCDPAWHRYQYACRQSLNGSSAVKMSMDEICQNGNKLHDTECISYCKHVQNTTLQSKIKEIHEMAVDVAGTMQDGNPHALLPACLLPPGSVYGDGSIAAKGCWRRVVNEKGVCYSSMTDKEIYNTEPVNGFSFALDSGNAIQINGENIANGVRIKHQLYDIMITPPDHYSSGQLNDADAYFFNATTDPKPKSFGVELTYVSEGTDDFASLSPEKRGCYYPNEKELQFFSNYHESNCYLECAWNVAVDKCHCAPWFLHENFPNEPICEAYGNVWFNDIVAKRYTNSKANGCAEKCLPDCDSVKYTISSYYGFGQEVAAYDKDYVQVEEDMFDDFVANKKAESSKDTINSLIEDLGKSRTTNLTPMNVHVNRKSTLVIMQTATASILDMIANIGGTLGLFCGFSILSAAEILYWCGKMAKF